MSRAARAFGLPSKARDRGAASTRVPIKEAEGEKGNGGQKGLEVAGMHRRQTLTIEAVQGERSGNEQCAVEGRPFPHRPVLPHTSSWFPAPARAHESTGRAARRP